MQVQAKDILPGDRIEMSWMLNSNLVVSVTPDPEFEGIVEIKTEGDAWIGSGLDIFNITRYSAEAQEFANTITRWSAEQVLDYYVSQSKANAYGVHDEELAILRKELLHVRMA